MKENYVPIQVMNTTHILEVPTPNDLIHLITNVTRRDNVDVFLFNLHIKFCEEKIGEPIDDFDEALFAGAMEWKWFLEDIMREGQKYVEDE